jgi:hypothetical protein
MPLDSEQGKDVFVYYFAHIDRSFSDTERRLLEMTGGLDGMAAAASRQGEDILARVGLGGEQARVAKTVRLSLGEPVRQPGTTVIPIVWEATGVPALFPRMEADLVLADLGPGLSQLTLQGSYTPPLGFIGRALDKALLHRVAEASVKGFVDQVARAIGEAAPKAPTAGGVT